LRGDAGRGDPDHVVGGVFVDDAQRGSDRRGLAGAGGGLDARDAVAVAGNLDTAAT